MSTKEENNYREAYDYEQLLLEYKNVCYQNKQLKEEIKELEKFQPKVEKHSTHFKTSWHFLGTIACLITYLIASFAPQGWQFGNALMENDYFERFFLWLCLPLGMFFICTLVFHLGDLLCDSWSNFLSLFFKGKTSKSWAKIILYILIAATIAFLK